MADQLSQIRKLYHDKYAKYVKNTGIESVLNNSSDDKKSETNIGELHCDQHIAQEILYNTEPESASYSDFNDNINDNTAEPLLSYDDCVNADEIKNIPPKYRFDVYITDNHILEYSEENISDANINLHRMMHTMVHEENPAILFRYCFDIRQIYPNRHKIIELYDGFYFLQPLDHERIIEQMKQIKN